jgi:hypothetical protein
MKIVAIFTPRAITRLVIATAGAPVHFLPRQKYRSGAFMLSLARSGTMIFPFKFYAVAFLQHVISAG